MERAAAVCASARPFETSTIDESCQPHACRRVTRMAT
jgi:hypothetical protein